MKVEFKNKNDQTLVGDLDKPRGQLPAVIICHGFTSNRNQPLIKDMAKALFKHKFVVLRFDFTGNGDSEGEFSEGSVMQEVDDVRKAMDFLEQKHGIHRFYVVGGSLGASIAGLAAAEDVRIRGVAMLNSGINYRRNSRKEYFRNIFRYIFKGYIDFRYEKHGKIVEHRVGRDFVRQFRSISMGSILRMVRQPKLFVIGTNDEKSTEEERKKLVDDSPGPKTVEYIDGADHHFTKHHKEVVDKVVGWLVKVNE